MSHTVEMANFYTVQIGRMAALITTIVVVVAVAVTSAVAQVVYKLLLFLFVLSLELGPLKFLSMFGKRQQLQQLQLQIDDNEPAKATY